MHPLLPLEAFLPATFLSSAMFAVPPPYLRELKSILMPEPAFCESVRCACVGCCNSLIRTENPMDFYDDSTYCSYECVELASTDSVDLYESEDEDDEDAFNNYIDSVLDSDW